MLTFKSISQCVWVLLLCYPFVLSATISSPSAITLYTEVEMKWKLFFLEALTLITVPSIVCSSVFTYQQGCRVPRLVRALLLLQQHWYLAPDLRTCCRQPPSHKMEEVCHQKHRLS